MGMVAYEMSTTTDMMGLENEEACKCYVENWQVASEMMVVKKSGLRFYCYYY